MCPLSSASFRSFTPPVGLLIWGVAPPPQRGIAPLRQSAGSSASTVQTGSNMLYKKLAHRLHDKEHRQGNNGSDPPPARRPGCRHPHCNDHIELGREMGALRKSLRGDRDRGELWIG
jgi:hypothetical protein